MEFRLIYSGPLPPQKHRSKPGELVQAKHAIRKQLHGQLVDLCAKEPLFLLVVAGLRGSPELGRALPQIDLMKLGRGWATWQDFQDVGRGLLRTGEKYRFGGFEYVPLLICTLGASCELDILFLRRERPGKLITKPRDEFGGDLDNRLKLFFDALRCPRNANEIPSNMAPETSEVPFLCLLEDDSLITRFQVESDTLLGPLPASQDPKAVHLVIKVTVKFTKKSRFSDLLP